jgi:B12-binding domain/radical SAM domain protein
VGLGGGQEGEKDNDITMKQKGVALIFHYPRDHRNSINALIGAIDADQDLNELEAAFADDAGKFLPAANSLLEKHGRIVCCFSFFTAQAKETCKWIRRLRRKLGEDALLVAGGPHATGAAEDTLAMGFDVAVRGEGEDTLIALVKSIRAGQDYSHLKGLAIKDTQGQVRDNGLSSPVDINRYLPFSARFRKMGSLEITRGCVFGCAFCQVSSLCGRKPRHRSLESVRAYAQALAERGMKQVRLISPNAFSYGSPDGRKINLAAMEAMMEAFKQEIGPDTVIFFGGFPSEVRPEFVNRDTLSIVKRHAANRRIVIGAQTGSDRMLKICRRGHTIADVYAAAESILSMEMEPVVDFIFGLPGEEKEDARATIKVMRELSAMGATLHAHTFMPLPGTLFAEEKPGKVREEIRQVVRKEFLPKGKLFGYWQKQERCGKRDEPTP